MAGPLRRAFVMAVNPGFEREYRTRHDEIWPELSGVLAEHGVRTYSIFLHPETLQLFAYVEYDSEDRWNAIAATGVCRRWWAFMRDIMPSHPDHSPVTRDLPEVFHFEPQPLARG